MLDISLEMIEYQNADPFPKELDRLFSNIINEIKTGVYKDNKTLIKESPYIKEIEKLVTKRFNMACTFSAELSVLSPAAIIPFYGDYLEKEYFFTKNISPQEIAKIFAGGFIDAIKQVEKIKKERNSVLQKLKHNEKGYIDLKNARLGGYLSQLRHYLIFDFVSLVQKGDINEKELTAIFLHELGHAFTGIENVYRLEKVNSTIYDILAHLNNNQPEKALYVFKKNFGDEDLKDFMISSDKERKVFLEKVLYRYLDELRSQLANGKYDETNFENMADSFAVRFNRGEDLARGLSKFMYGKDLYGKDFNVFTDNLISSMRLFIFFLKEFYFMFIALTSHGIIGLFFYLILMYAIRFILYPNQLTYDYPKDRINRIKNGIINNLKNINLPQEMLNQLLEQYVYVNTVIENLSKYVDYNEWVLKYYGPLLPKQKYYIKLQQTIENVLNNTLFVSSAKLKVS